ncbi:MAG: site-specific integrase [Candidatus Bathyarchaeota archaeon]|nr:site-specific integrase [Candidatus Bathyarchaeota archaeon]
MRQKVEIYDYNRKIENALRRINTSCTPLDKTAILDFYYDSLTRGLSKARLLKYLTTLELISRLLEKPLKSATKTDIADFIRKIEAKDYSSWTKHDYKVILKLFYRWLRKTEDYPEEVSWIRTAFKDKNLLPSEILTENDVKKLVEHAGTLRDRAFILTLYESGCRVGEILSLRIRNIQFDQYGAVLLVSGKTGDRRVRIIAAAPIVATWIENHPLREDINSPLWVNLSSRNRHSPFGYCSAKTMLKDAAIAAGIKKRVYPHLFRHSRATFLANHLTEAQLNHHFGWVQASNMASTYVHLSGRDVDGSLLKLQGIKVETAESETAFRPTNCPRCNESNSPTSKFCKRCGAPLDVATAVKVDETRAKADKLMTFLIQDPEVLNLLIKKIETIQDKN